MVTGQTVDEMSVQEGVFGLGPWGSALVASPLHAGAPTKWRASHMLPHRRRTCFSTLSASCAALPRWYYGFRQLQASDVSGGYRRDSVLSRRCSVNLKCF